MNNYTKYKQSQNINKNIENEKSGFKNMTPICCLLKTHFKYNDIGRLKVKGWKRVYHTNIIQIKARMTLLISD